MLTPGRWACQQCYHKQCMSSAGVLDMLEEELSDMHVREPDRGAEHS